MGLSFGVTVLPDPPYQRFIELLQIAERHGFEYGWTYDSHVLWQESMPTLALAAAATERIKLGHMVTNPGTRDPTVLAVAGRVGDGVVIQLADPDIIQWIMATARAAAEEAGRDPAALKCIVSAPSHITDDIAAAREQVRWFPAMVSNHVRDLIRRYGADGSGVPRALTDYVPDETGYDYDEHSRDGANDGPL